MTEKPQPRTAFHWGIYADATLAGLSTLIPVPLVDMLFEDFFRRRMPHAIARTRKQDLHQDIITQINWSDSDCLTGCVLLPFRLAYELIKRLSRKLLYFLTIKDAADRVSYYWHRAFLIDYALLLGHLDTPDAAARARCAMLQALDSADTSPLAQLAHQIVSGTRGIFRHLRRARRGESDPLVDEKREQLARGWANVEVYLRSVARRYDEWYEKCVPKAE